MSTVRLYTVLSLLLLLTACRNGEDVSAALGEIPDTISENFSQVTVSDQGRVEIDAGRVETYNKKDMTMFYYAGMRELNTEGSLVLEGSADRIELMGNRDGSAEGDIRVHDMEEDSHLAAERLDWDDGNRILTGTGEVIIESGDGITITGEGFSADMARETFTYSDGVQGTLEVDDEES